METKNFLADVLDGTSFEGIARLVSRRNMGKICFCDARFQENQAQLVFDRGVLLNYSDLAKAPLGSLLYISGNKIVTLAGTPSIEVKEAELLFASEGFWPDKYHGLNQPIRYRNRVYDLLINQDAFIFFKKMSLALSIIRSTLYERSFHEFITGVLQETFEAGQAHSFSTLCRANGKDLYLSLTSELKLKRLIVAGFERVFEIAQSFRNEGIDSIHSPEFTMLEIYEVGSDCGLMMKLLEEIVHRVVQECEGGNSVPYFKEGCEMPILVSYAKPFLRISFRQSFEEMVGPWDNCELEKLSKIYPDLFNNKMTRFTWLMKVIEKLIVPNIVAPTFLTDLPAGMSPFVRNNDEVTSDRSFFIAQGTFLADIYSDENDFSKLSLALKIQADEIGTNLNSDYLDIIKMGIPKTAGIGMGLNRLLMLLLHELPCNIKETILYPIL